MKKLNLLLGAFSLFTVVGLSSCGGDPSKTINICASDIPHAEILNNVVKDVLKEKGYTLNVTIINWETQNDAVANKDYDANYFQHIPYLESYKGTGNKKLVATAKVHYEPLSIYKGKASAGNLSSGKTFEICADTSNAIRAFQLLKDYEVLSEIPVNEDGTALTFSGSTYTQGDITVTLIDESLLASSLLDYDFGLLPSNTALTAKLNKTAHPAVASEKDPAQVTAKANVIAVREQDYKNDEVYASKIDALTDAVLSEQTRNYIANTYNGAVICNAQTQIDLRNTIK